MRTLALVPFLLATAGIASAGPPREPYEPPPQPKVCWECSLELLVQDGSPGGSVWTYEAAGKSAEACSEALYDQIVSDFGTPPPSDSLRLPDGGAFYVHPEWVDYYATVNMLVGIWDEGSCDDSEWSPSVPPHPGDRDEPAG